MDLMTFFNSRKENDFSSTWFTVREKEKITAGKANKQQSVIKKFKLSFRVPKKKVDILTIKGPNTQPNVLETFNNPNARPLFLAFPATKASLGEAKVPFAMRSKVLENNTIHGDGKNNMALEANAMPVEHRKIFLLFLILSNSTPLASLKTLERNSVIPSKIPRISKERPRESVIRNGMMVIPIVVETAKRKFIK